MVAWRKEAKRRRKIVREAETTTTTKNCTHQMMIYTRTMYCIFAHARHARTKVMHASRRQATTQRVELQTDIVKNTYTLSRDEDIRGHLKWRSGNKSERCAQ